MLDATPFQIAQARRGLNVAMISNLKRSRRHAATLCTFLWLLLCPGLRFVAHSHDEFLEPTTGLASLERHLHAFHKLSDNSPGSDDSLDPQKLHYHWLFELPGAMHLGCCPHPGLDDCAAHTSPGFGCSGFGQADLGSPDADPALGDCGIGDCGLVVADDASNILLPCVANGNTGPNGTLEWPLHPQPSASIHAGWSQRSRLQSLLCVLRI
jgi:hypothetical protein